MGKLMAGTMDTEPGLEGAITITTLTTNPILLVSHLIRFFFRIKPVPHVLKHFK